MQYLQTQTRNLSENIILKILQIYKNTCQNNFVETHAEYTLFLCELFLWYQLQTNSAFKLSKMFASQSLLFTHDHARIYLNDVDNKVFFCE